ncbi:MAG: Tail Collar domain protein [Firmicutes bacterium]|nr:Tail Collar domain protein [Bacillota bacterium]
MSNTVDITGEIIVVSHGDEDTGKIAMLGDEGKFHKSVIPVIDDLQEQITKEVTGRTEADKQLQTNIDAETSTRISADQQMQGNIEAEAIARDAADKGLEDKLSAEATARTNADIQLQANLEAEANTRRIADQDLQDQISKEIVARTDGDTALQSSVDKEVVARSDADSKLQGSIDNEVDTRVKADQGLQDQVTAEIAARTNADETESSTRASADNNLQEQINALKGSTFDAGHSFSDNGYQSLGNGLILQWGHAQLSKGENIGNASVTFPTPFPNKCLSFTTTYDNPPQDSWGPMSTAITNVTKVGCTLWGDADEHHIDNNVNIYYMAIGY